MRDVEESKEALQDEVSWWDKPLFKISLLGLVVILAFWFWLFSRVGVVPVVLLILSLVILFAV